MSQETLSLAKVDEALNPIIDGLALALTQCRPVVVYNLWHFLPYTALIPFHLHLRWAGKFDALPLSITCSFVPFLSKDASLTRVPLYQTEEANAVRRQARIHRNNLKSNFANDFVHPDWEEGLIKHRATLRGKLLPGCSFLSVDTVGQFGQITRGHRPYLGARAVRNAPRPHILVPAHGTLSKEAYKVLASTDLLLVNLQKIRGQNSLAVIREVLLARGNNLPSLIIASSPSDLSAIKWDELAIDSTNYFLGTTPNPSKIEVTIVGKDRPQLERDFNFAVAELRGYSPLVDNLARLATNAWWAGRQSIVQEDKEDLNFRRFLDALEQARIESPSEARMFTSAENLISKTFEDQELSQERLEATLDAIFAVPNKKRTLVLTKHAGVAAQLQTAIANAVGVTKEEVINAGIACCGTNFPLFDAKYDHAITCGYFGNLTIDYLLASNATEIRMIFDPVEASIAWHNIHDMNKFVQGPASSGAQEVLQHLSSALHPHLLPFTGTVSLTLNDAAFREFLQFAAPFPNPHIDKRNGQKNVIILFVDGTWIEVPQTARMEIIDRQGGIKLRTVVPTDLQAGDEVVIVASDGYSLFSEKLIYTLDNGKFRSLAEQRDIWFTLLNTAVREIRPNVRTMHRKLSEKGVQVSYQTILSWIRPVGQTIPMYWQHFKALVEALDLTLPEAYLTELFNAIRQLRVRHRLAGRNLVRAMRSAYLGRLDSSTLAQIEQEWSISARELMQNARLGEVDSVLM